MKLHKFTWNYIQITKKIINSRSSKSKSHSRSPLALWQISTLVVTVHSPLSTVQSSGNFNIFAELCIRVSPSTMNDKCTHSVKLWTADKSKHHSLNCVIAITHISIANIDTNQVSTSRASESESDKARQWLDLASNTDIASKVRNLFHNIRDCFWYSVLKEKDKNVLSQYIVLLWNLIDKYKKHY